MKNIYLKFKKLDFYSKGVLLSIPLTAALLIYLLSIGAADLVFSEWFLNLISAPIFIASQLTTFAYIGRITDLFLHFRDKAFANKKEMIGTIAGFLFGIAVGVGLSVMQVPVPLLSSLGIFANILFVGRQINVFAGLGNRIGRSTDKGSRPLSERVLILTAAGAGLALGIILFATCTAAMITVIGITAFFSGGFAVPAWIAGIIFVLAVSSSLASTADYTAKGISFIRSYFIAEGDVTRKVKDSRFEYGGSLLGVALGLIIGITIVSAIVILNPPLLAGIVGIVAGLLIVTTAAAVMGTITNHLGKIVDGLRKKDISPVMPAIITPKERVYAHDDIATIKPALSHIHTIPLRRSKSEPQLAKSRLSFFTKADSNTPSQAACQKPCTKIKYSG